MPVIDLKIQGAVWGVPQKHDLERAEAALGIKLD
jgi:hypothetical protein